MLITFPVVCEFRTVGQKRLGKGKLDWVALAGASIAIRLPIARVEACPSFNAFQYRWPSLPITCHRREGSIGEQVESALETFASYAMLNRRLSDPAGRNASKA
jgi:hypothetical protein